MSGVSKAMAGVQKEMSKAAAQLPQHSKYAHHLTTESYTTTAAREAQYMCAQALAVSPLPQKTRDTLHSKTCTYPPSLRVLVYAWHACCMAPPFAQNRQLAECSLLYCRWPFLVGFAVTGTIFFNIARGLTGARAQAVPCSS